MLCSCTNQSIQFNVISDYDYFSDVGDIGFYKTGKLYGFIRLNGDTSGLKQFALDKKVSETISLESIKCYNGFATFSTKEGVLPKQKGFMDLNGNIKSSINMYIMEIYSFSKKGVNHEKIFTKVFICST